MTNPAWVVLFTKIAGLVTNAGGITAHPAVLVREFGIPAVVGTQDATEPHQQRRPRARRRQHGRVDILERAAQFRERPDERLTARKKAPIDVGTDTRTLSPLQQTAATATDIWNDSCAVDELEYAIEHGAVGATANPTIVHDVWKKDPERWAERVRELADRAARRDRDASGLGHRRGDVARGRRDCSMPAFERSGGRQGRLSMQTNPTFWRSFEPMLGQGVHFMTSRPTSSSSSRRRRSASR